MQVEAGLMISIIDEGEETKMETKSRYEILKELNDKKEALMREKESIELAKFNYLKEIKKRERELEDYKEGVEAWKKNIPRQIELITDLIKSVDASINSLSEVHAGKK